MIIRCPHCAFSRTVDDNRIPAAAQTATCPKCHHKFRFRGDEAPVEGHAAAEGHTRAPATEPFAESASESAPGQSSASAGTYGDAPAGFGGAGQEAPGQGVFTQDGSASESGEDIWDRVASLGERWADDADFDQIGEAGASGKDAPWSEERGPVEGAPWEHIRNLGLLRAFGQTVFRAALQPRRFFSALGGPRFLGLALVFYITVTTLQTYLFQAWMQLFPASALGLGLPSDYALYDSTRPLYVMLAAPFVWAFFLLLVSSVSAVAARLLGGGRASPAAVMRVLAYSVSPMLLGVVPFVGTILGQAWALVLFMLGCKHAFRLSLLTALAVTLPVYLCLAVLRIILSGSF